MAVPHRAVSVPYRQYRDRTLTLSKQGAAMPKESRVSQSDIERVRLLWIADESMSIAQVADLLGVSKSQANRVMLKNRWLRIGNTPDAGAPASQAKFTEKPMDRASIAPPIEAARVPQPAPAPARTHAAPDKNGAPGAWYIPPPPDGLDEWATRDYWQHETEALVRKQNERQSQEQRVLSAQWVQAMKRSVTDPDEARAHKSLTEAMKLRHAMERESLHDFCRLTLNSMPVLLTNGCSTRIQILIVPGLQLGQTFEPPAGARTKTVGSYLEGCEALRRAGDIEDVESREIGE